MNGPKIGFFSMRGCDTQKSGPRRTDKPFVPRLIRHRGLAPVCSRKMPVRIKRVCRPLLPRREAAGGEGRGDEGAVFLYLR